MKFTFASLIISIVIAKPLVSQGCPTNACDAYALKNPTKKISCISTNGSRGCIYEYNLNGSTAKCNAALSSRLTGGKIITC